MTENSPKYLPTQEEIAAECKRIQASWTPEVRLRRLSADLRPTVRCGDSTMAEVSSESLEAHQANGDAVVGEGATKPGITLGGGEW